MTDAELIAQVRAGDVNAFEPLITRHREQVFAIVARHVPGAQVSETAHEAFVRAFLSLKTYRAEKPFAHWLARIAVRTCYDFWRQQKRRPETPASVLDDDNQEWLERAAQGLARETFAHETAQREAAEVLDWALARVSAADRLVLTMLHRDGHSVADIAALLGWTQTRVKVTAFRARLKLRGILAGQMKGLR
ncbi:MAG: RNA polymerase sigma factor [Kiritimatiellaeota bacterium]|nr:RNA polymerase sigma factor [Kiritimatiellota bacterium]